MSSIIWSTKMIPTTDSVKELVPDLYDGGTFRVANTLSFSKTDEELVDLPDRRAYRSMSRAAVLLSAVCLPAKSVLADFLGKDPFSVGIYCAVENGPTDYNCAKQMISTPAEEFGALYKKLRTPKQYLRQLPNLAPAQMGIFLSIMGPMNVYNHSTAGCKQALDQAEWDLANGTVKAALVCSAFSNEDPLLVKRARRTLGKTPVISEGAAAVVLVANGKETKWDGVELDPAINYGIADLLVQSIKTQGGSHV